MYVEKLSLKDFRNYNNLNLEFGGGVNIIKGPNARGKTNLLEAVYLCATGRSQRAGNDREMILFGSDEAHIQVLVKKEKYCDRIDVHLKKEGRKGIAVNGSAVRKLSDLFGELLTVIFSPEDLQLVKSGPAERRRFADLELCQLNGVYYYELQQYCRVLKQRNNLLREISRDGGLRETLFAWDEQLVRHGRRIIGFREEFIERLSGLSEMEHSKITGGKEKLGIIYKKSVSGEDFAAKLERYAETDIRFGSTSVGIHKDDLQFTVNGCDARVFGSQGQQRTAALSLKLAEIELIREEKGETPVLLLDDVLSELDGDRQRCLLDGLEDVQTLLTCTGVEEILHGKYGGNVFDIS